MTSRNNSNDVVDTSDNRSKNERKERPKDLSVLPPSGTSLHKRRRGEPPAAITVKSPQTPTEDSYSPCTASIKEESCWNTTDMYYPDPETVCEKMLEILKERDDLLAQQGKEIATKTKKTVDAFDELEKLLELLDQLVTYKLKNDRILQKLKDVNDFKKLLEARKHLEIENERLMTEKRELELINEAIDGKFENDYGQIILESILPGGRMKRSGSKWKGHARFGGSLLRKPRSRSAGGDDSDAAPSLSHRRRSDGIFIKDVDKSKVSKWTRVKSAFRWEKAQWQPNTLAGAAGVFAAGAMVGAVALAGSNPPATPGISVTTSSSFPPTATSAFLQSTSGMSLTTSASASAALANPERDSASLTPGSAMSLTPNSSCEELRINSDIHRKSIHEDNYLHAPIQDDSSTSPSPNKLHKSPWNKMRDIIQTRRDSVKKKSTRGSKSSPDVVPTRRRSLSDGGDSDAPPALTLTIPSSEELESDPHPLLRKQRSLELGARPPQHRPPRASKWTKVKRAFLTSASVSVPSSPSRHSAFFTDADTEGVSSGCEAGAVQEEIARDYAALQLRLGREFSDRRGKLHSTAIRPVATEEQLSADFRKKLNEWQRMKGVRQPPPIPARQDLSEDFLRKWDAWNRMKETNSVPAWEEGAKPEEVLVQTSTGLFKFQGISRSFTRKLHEWEKSRGIAPEASTSALLRAARAQPAVPAAALTRTHSDGSVAPSPTGSARLHASSLSVNDADDFESEYERENYQHSLEGVDECDGSNTRGAVIVEVEDEEVCTAAPLMAVSPRHTPQKPVYTYGPAEARLLCETNSAVTGTAVLQPNPKISETPKTNDESKTTIKQTRVEAFPLERSNRKKVIRQPSIEEDALFIRKTIEEIERGCSSHLKKIEDNGFVEKEDVFTQCVKEEDFSYKRKENSIVNVRNNFVKQSSMEETLDDVRRKDGNGKKKTKSRARLEREQSKPSESDTEPEVDTVTVEIPRRKKRPRRASEKPPTSMQCDSEGEVYVLKLRAPEVRESSPEVIVKTTRKIFSPIVRSGESVPSAVISVDVEDLPEVRRSTPKTNPVVETKRKITSRAERKKEYTRSKSSGDLQDGEEQRTRSRPPLPLSPSSQRKPQPKETAPSIRIMIQRYNMKINEEGHTSGASSGASSPAWRSPTAERKRPLDMPVGVNIRNNPFLEREVQKSASACQLSRRDQTSVEKHLTPTSSTNLEGVLKSHSANALHPENNEESCPQTKQKKVQDSQETIKCTTASTDTIVPIVTKERDQPEKLEEPAVYVPIIRQFSDTVVPSSSKNLGNYVLDRSFSSSGESPHVENSASIAAKLSERAARIKAARDKFLFSAPSMRREGTSSTSDLRPGDRSSRISYESDVTESPTVKQINLGRSPSNLGRSASTGMVNVERDAWQRVADGQHRDRPRSRFSLSRLAAKFRRKDESSIAKLCRQSLLVQLKKQ